MTSSVAPPALSGLTAAEAAERLRRDGPNALPAPRRPSAWRQLAGQLTHFFALLLWLAAGLALIGDLPQLSGAIAIVIVFNALFAFAQEHRADQAAERLRDLVPQHVTVRRSGDPLVVGAEEVVVGDVLLLEAGDRIPADARLSVAHGLRVDTSLLTGESDANTVEAGDPVHAGTFVVEGEGAAEVTATGSQTRLASIARLTTGSAAPPSPLTTELNRVVRTIAYIAIGVGIAFFVLSVWLGEEPSDGFVFAIGVTVALVPEALLPTVTLSLAWGAEQMAKHNVLVRHLEAVETLGSTTFVCTDKTGTLTHNQMTVVQVWTPRGSALTSTPGYDPVAPVALSDPAAETAVHRAVVAAVRSSTGFVREVDGEWQAHGEPMEGAIDVFARRFGIDTARIRATPPTARFPFDPRRRRMSVVTEDVVAVKGAPDSVLPLCVDPVPTDAIIEDLTSRGLRLLAVAGRTWHGEPPPSATEAEDRLELYGIIALHDPPRLDVAPAIAACRHAGVKIAMVTGDHPATAEAIAKEVGLHLSGAPVISGSDLPADDDALGRLIDHDGAIVARVSPEDKLRIARALRARGHVVAMTGDGVNDGPALHEADIGIAMGASGTDVAREAADFVLLDDRFHSLVAGIEHGRAAFLNIRRFLTYHLTDNVAELTPFLVWALSGGRFPLALGVLQILALDIGTDTFSAVALGAEPPSQRVLDRPPMAGRLLTRTVFRRSFGVLGPTEAAMSMTAFVASLLVTGWRPSSDVPVGEALTAASGAAFLAVVFAQAANAFACRSSTKPPWQLGWTTNRLLPLAVAVGVFVAVAAVLVGPVARVLGGTSPPPVGWAVALAAAPVLLAVDALDKHMASRRQPARGAGSRA